MSKAVVLSSNPPAAELAEHRITLRTTFKVSTKLRNGILVNKLPVHKVVYPEESDMPMMDMGVLLYI